MKHLLITSVLLCFVILLTAQCPQLIWSDEFDGNALDLNKWEPQTGNGCDINLCGWGNNELQYYQAANATVGGGTLKITAKPEQVGGNNYTSARLRTKNKADFTYGRMEARIKLPHTQGIWPAFWMLPTDEVYGGWPQSGEIDILELIGKEPDIAHGTIHFGNPWPNNQSSTANYQLLAGIFKDDFHEFAIEWEPGVIRWYVDGYLFSTKTAAGIAPAKWPFDQDFHFLLNVAVGGNWPGNPDNTTVFPQVMEVDYVRVYNQSRPSIAGMRQVAQQQEQVLYSISNAGTNASYEWKVPDGASIVSGQGTDQITVNWGNGSGQVEVTINSDCITENLALYVLVETPLQYDFSFENFDDPALINFSFATGNLSADITNPSLEALNPSPLAGRYIRSSGDQYDVLIYTTEAIEDASKYVDGTYKFTIDIFSSAPVGTEVLLQLEDSKKSTPANFPAGRHSRFQAFTTVQNQWERLEFTFLDRPDGNILNNAIDRLIFLFAPNTFTGNTYVWDNFDSYSRSPGQTTAVDSKNDRTGFPFEVYPNPTKESLTVKLRDHHPVKKINVLDINGKLIQAIRVNETEIIKEVDVRQIPSGTYILQMETLLGKSYSYKFFKE